MFSLFIVISLILLSLITVLTVLRLRFNAKVNALIQRIDTALDARLKILQIEHRITDEEQYAYILNHRQLNDDCMALVKNRRLSKDKQAHLRNFIQLFSNFSDDVEKYRDYFDRIGKINYVIADALAIADEIIKMKETDYITNSIIKNYKIRFEKTYTHIKILKEQSLIYYFKDIDAVMRFYDFYENLDAFKKEANEEFRIRELANNKEFFDTILSYPLDKQQRDAIVDLEDACLVISSAGSGKTSTMVGKILYLLYIRKVPASKILAVTFTRKASNELSQRLPSKDLKCVTFHKLAIDIIGEVTGKKPTIAEDSVLENVFNTLIKDKAFRRSVITYIENYKSIFDDRQTTDCKDFYSERNKKGVKALYCDSVGNTIYTKSEQEKQIVTYLTHWGIKFKYEEKYEFDTNTSAYRQYKPDFTIYYTDGFGKTRKLYLEHFGIDKDGNVPQFFGKTNKKTDWYEANRQYNEGIVWKKALHKEKGTLLIYTTSADFYDGTAKKKLFEQLKRYNIPINPLNDEQIYERLNKDNFGLEQTMFKTCQSFISLMKANRKDFGQLTRLINNDILQGESKRYCLDNIIQPLYYAYQSELKSRGEIDFTDAITTATDICNQKQFSDYDYILIDEFQDISIDRYEFIRSLRKTTPLTKLFCVGDDWQSIYRFTGSDMALFTQFSKFFGYTDKLKIETTYRFGYPAVSISSEFIQKNKIQLKKDIHPFNRATQTDIEFCSYKDKNDACHQIVDIVKNIPAEKSIYIIGRYNFDFKTLADGGLKVSFNTQTDTRSVEIAGRKINFLSVHSAKGLEADYVILLNCNSGTTGFPSQLADDPILDIVLSTPDEYEFGEERRVFYVAITRAKIKTIIFFDERNISPFVTELYVEPKHQGLNRCPICGIGYRVPKKSGKTKTGAPYTYFICSNWQLRCPYEETVFGVQYDTQNA